MKSIAAFFYFLIYGIYLNFPAEMYYDEVYLVNTARVLSGLNGYPPTAHPPFGTMLISLSILLFGDHPWAWRLPSLIAGWGCVVMLYLITKNLTNSKRAAFLAALLFFFDGISFTQARIGMLNSIMLFFMLASLFCLMKGALSCQWPQTKALGLCGLFWGLAMGTRWVAISIIPLLAILAFKLLRQSKNRKRAFIDLFIYLGALPIAMYFCTFIIFLFIKGHDLASIWNYQLYMFNYHLNLKASHTYGSQWWGWPFLSRPIWYFYKETTNLFSSGGKCIQGILCMGNQVIFWSIFLGMGYLAIEFLKKRPWAYGFILAGFLTQWLQWAPVARVTFFHYFYTAVPFAAMAMGICLDALWQAGLKGRCATLIYLAAVIGMFIYWYPLLNGMAISEAYFRQHMWFPAWI